MSAGGLDRRPKFLSLSIEIYNHWLPPVLHQKQVALLGALEADRVPRSSNQSARHLFHRLSLQGMARTRSTGTRPIEQHEEIFDATVFFRLNKQRRYEWNSCMVKMRLEAGACRSLKLLNSVT
jgi:hypothetical protein